MNEHVEWLPEGQDPDELARRRWMKKQVENAPALTPEQRKKLEKLLLDHVVDDEDENGDEQ